MTQDLPPDHISAIVEMALSDHASFAQIEAEYGSRMDAYPAHLALDGAERRVDVLALGRSFWNAD